MFIEMWKDAKGKVEWLNLQHRVTSRLFSNLPPRALSILYYILTVPFCPAPNCYFCRPAIPPQALGPLRAVKARGTARTCWVRRHCYHPVMSVPWNFAFSTDNASGTHKDSADTQGVEGQCLQGIKVRCKTNCCWGFLCTPGKCSQEELAEITLNIVTIWNGTSFLLRKKKKKCVGGDRDKDWTIYTWHTDIHRHRSWHTQLVPT